jgi:pullulanase/glycogen debranching enzyme
MHGSCDFNWEEPRITTYPGKPHPLGAQYDGHGINFALYSEYATNVYLCLFRPRHDEKHQLLEYAQIRMKGNRFITCFESIYDYDYFNFIYIEHFYSNVVIFFRTNSSDLAYLFT